ncbi:DNA utilization family protein [Erwinia mallotivora]|uniref:DUF2531 family protein n=1 Tax=Erwinia mallotivora TaxID=69222 RepID=A0A014MEP4_9GAMM|nr:DNA utilization family protein [Erwinia mallotivora]EXU76534.1 hypothetical protein BG55_05030 [Erwinia mallotivora]
MMIFNRWRYNLLLFSLLFSPAGQSERDPFQPPQEADCLNVQPAAAPWQLRGIVGQPDDYRAWLVSPEGRGKLWARQQSPGNQWQLSQVDARGLTLASMQGCKAVLKMTLKGDIYARDKGNSAAVTDDGALSAARQPHRVVSGVR